MRSPSDAELLALWEAGRPMDPHRRAVAVVCAADPALSPGEVLDWPLGRRERALLHLYAAWFGDALEVRLACPRCEAALEASLPVTALLAESAPREVFTLDIEGVERRARPVTTRDLLAVSQLGRADAARDALAGRLLLDDAPLSGPSLAALAEAASAADPLAEIRLKTACAGCGEAFAASVEVVDHVWAAITGRAQEIVREVHELAQIYHWSEGEILGMSRTRRDAYLRMVRA